MAENMVDGLNASNEEIPGISPVVDTASIKGLETVIETPEQAQEREKRKWTPPKKYSSIDELKAATVDIESRADALLVDIAAVRRSLPELISSVMDSLDRKSELENENSELKAKLERIKSAASEI